MIDFLFSMNFVGHNLVDIVVELAHILVDSMVYYRIVVVVVVDSSLEID